MENVQYDFFYHEHFSYYSIIALQPFLRRFGLHIFDVQQVYSCPRRDSCVDSAAHGRTDGRTDGLHQSGTVRANARRFSIRRLSNVLSAASDCVTPISG